MRLGQVDLKNFRNYTNLSVTTDADLVLILGQNASGKTNFLESVYFLSQLKSFRSPDQLLVSYSQDYFNLTGHQDGQTYEALVQIEPKLARQFKIDGKKTTRNLWQSFPTVLFVPNDLNLFILGPVFRRKLLDEILSQKDQVYAADLSSLHHILKQRQGLLQLLGQGLGERLELEFWNQQLTEISLRILAARLRLVAFWNSKFKTVNQNLTGFNHEYEIDFTSFQSFNNSELFLTELGRLAEAEIRSGKNLFGPQRDDFIIKKNQELNLYNSSRGELRAQIIALKLLQAEYLTNEKQKPIILLDDVFSELDETRRTKLLENLTGYQIFITTTEEHHLPKLTKDALVLNVENNKIL